MSPSRFRQNFPTLPFLALVLTLAGCATSRPPAPVMPPSPPPETPPATSTPLPQSPSKPQTAEGQTDSISLYLGQQPVTLDTLPALAPDDQPRTVRIEASPATRYAKVERVLETLHDLGYLIEFRPAPSP
jgi:hypothetical protein